MNVQVKSSNGIILIPLESRLMAERKIFIEGEIDQESACEFIKKNHAADQRRQRDAHRRSHQFTRRRNQFRAADV